MRDMIYVLIKMVGVVTCTYPIVTIYGVCLHTGSTGDPAMPQVSVVNLYKYLSSTSDHVYALSTYNAIVGGIRVLDVYGNLRGTGDSVGATQTMTIKDSLKMVVSSRFTTASLRILSMQKSTATGGYALSSDYQTTLAYFGQSDIDDPTSSVYVTLCDREYIYKIDTVSFSTTTPVNYMTTIQNTFEMQAIQDTYLICKASQALPILRRDNFAPIKSPSQSINYLDTFLMDNLDDNILYSQQNNVLLHSFDLLSSMASTVINATLNLASYGMTNIMLNLGSLKYIIHLPSAVDRSEAMMISKPNLLVYLPGNYLLSITGQSIKTRSVSREFMIVKDNYYFSALGQNTANTSQYNFQSYFLLVDNCTVRDGFNTCTLCPPNSYKSNLLPNNTCISPLDFPLGVGIDIAISSISECVVERCVSCRYDYTLCDMCDTYNGYMINSTTSDCYIIFTPLYFTISHNDGYSSSDVDVSYVMTTKLSVNELGEVMNEMKRHKESISLSLYAAGDTSVNKVDGLKYEVSMGVVNSTSLSVGFDIDISKLEAVDYIVKVEATNRYNITVNGKIYEIRIESGDGEFKNNYLVKLSKNERMVGIVLDRFTDGASFFSNSSSPAVITVSIVLLLADTQGNFFRLTKVLQIVNKLAFINVDFGPKLESFLLKTAAITQYESDPSHPQQVFNSKRYRGKVSKYKTTFDVMRYMAYRLIAYYASWILRCLKRYLMNTKQMNKVGIYMCHYSNKIHLVIFNLIFIDFIWLASRAMLHGRNLPLNRTIPTIITFALMFFDFWLIIIHLLNSKIWKRAYRNNLTLKTLISATEPIEKKLSMRKSSEISIKTPNTPLPRNFLRKNLSQSKDSSISNLRRKNQIAQSVNEKKKIDYVKTYREIDYNTHLMKVATSQLALNKAAYESVLCRLLISSLWLRMPYIQSVIISCQYNNTGCVFVLSLIESCKLFATLYAYIRYRHIRSLVLFFIDISQSLCMIIFLLNTLLQMYDKQNVSLDNIHQSVGIYTILGMCGIEYLLTIWFIFTDMYYSLKIRSYKKKNNLKNMPNEIIFTMNDDNEANRMRVNDSEQILNKDNNNHLKNISSNNRINKKASFSGSVTKNNRVNSIDRSSMSMKYKVHQSDQPYLTIKKNSYKFAGKMTMRSRLKALEKEKEKLGEENLI